MVYLPALSIKISQMWVHNSYMDPSWDNIFKHPTSGDQDRTHQLHSMIFQTGSPVFCTHLLSIGDWWYKTTNSAFFLAAFASFSSLRIRRPFLRAE